MEIIGFIAILLLGLYVTVAGFIITYVGYAFSGRLSWEAVLLVICGLTILGLDIWNAPFSINMSVRE